MKEHPASHLMPNEEAAVEAYVDLIQEQYPNRIEALILFGSKARGDANTESDIDLLVMVDVETREFRSKLWQIASDISLEFNVVLSPRVIGQARWAELSRMCLPLYRAITADGIVLIPERVSI